MNRAKGWRIQTGIRTNPLVSVAIPVSEFVRKRFSRVSRTGNNGNLFRKARRHRWGSAEKSRKKSACYPAESGRKSTLMKSTQTQFPIILSVRSRFHIYQGDIV
jgi:hypothetical protein